MTDHTSDNPGLPPERWFTADMRAGGPAPVDRVARIVAAARHALTVPRGYWTYARVRPFTLPLFGPRHWTGDCSGFVIACYQAAGATDPGGYGYSGAGNTDSLWARGDQVDSPDPGRLAFWRAPDHVAVCIDGAGGIVEFGAPPAPVRATVAVENGYHASFEGYRDYHPNGRGVIVPHQAPPDVSVGQYDDSAIIRNAWSQFGLHGKRAFANARQTRFLATGVSHVDTLGPR